MVSRFGELLKLYRTQSRDKERRRPLTQERLAELLSRLVGDAGYTGGAVSEWERGKSQIPHTQRAVLVGLVRVLYEAGGLTTLTQANTFLTAGNYRPVDATETRYVSPAWANNQTEHTSSTPADGPWRLILLSILELVIRPSEAIIELQPVSGRASPDWTDTLLAVFGWPGRAMADIPMYRVVVWPGVWLVGWALTFPLMQWPYANERQAWQAVVLYGAGAVIIPLIIGALTRTQADVFWAQQPDIDQRTLRAFTYQGAFIGFHVGYLPIVGAALVGHYLGVERVPRWLELIVALWPIILSYAAARQIPFNLWRAYGHLRFSRQDGLFLLAFAGVGPAWAAFFGAYSGWLLYPPFGGLVMVALTVISFIRASTPSKLDL